VGALAGGDVEEPKYDNSLLPLEIPTQNLAAGNILYSLPEKLLNIFLSNYGADNQGDARLGLDLIEATITASEDIG